MAVRRDAVTGNKIVRMKKFLGLFGWVKDYAHSNTIEFYKWKMNLAVDEFSKFEKLLREEEARQKALIKEIGNSSGDLICYGPLYKIPGMFDAPKEREVYTKKLVCKQEDDWKPFARVLYGYGSNIIGASGGGQTKHMTIDVPKPKDVKFEGEELDVFPVPQRNNNNNQKQRGNNNNQNQRNN